MTDLQLLNTKIADSGLKKKHIARYMSLSDAALSNKLRGLRDFTVREMQALSSLLHLTDRENKAIFFNKKVDKNSTRCDCL